MGIYKEPFDYVNSRIKRREEIDLNKLLTSEIARNKFLIDKNNKNEILLKNIVIELNKCKDLKFKQKVMQLIMNG